MDAQKPQNSFDLTATVVGQLFTYEAQQARRGKPLTATDVNRVVDDHLYRHELRRKLEGNLSSAALERAVNMRFQEPTYMTSNADVTDDAEVATLQNINRLVADAVVTRQARADAKVLGFRHKLR